jgi:hypothetical protein
MENGAMAVMAASRTAMRRGAALIGKSSLPHSTGAAFPLAAGRDPAGCD